MSVEIPPYSPSNEPLTPTGGKAYYDIVKHLLDIQTQNAITTPINDGDPLDPSVLVAPNSYWRVEQLCPSSSSDAEEVLALVTRRVEADIDPELHSQVRLHVHRDGDQYTVSRVHFGGRQVGYNVRYRPESWSTTPACLADLASALMLRDRVEAEQAVYRGASKIDMSPFERDFPPELAAQSDVEKQRRWLRVRQIIGRALMLRAFRRPSNG